MDTYVYTHVCSVGRAPCSNHEACQCTIIRAKLVTPSEMENGDQWPFVAFCGLAEKYLGIDYYSEAEAQSRRMY